MLTRSTLAAQIADFGPQVWEMNDMPEVNPIGWVGQITNNNYINLIPAKEGEIEGGCDDKSSFGAPPPLTNNEDSSNDECNSMDKDTTDNKSMYYYESSDDKDEPTVTTRSGTAIWASE